MTDARSAPRAPDEAGPWAALARLTEAAYARAVDGDVGAATALITEREAVLAGLRRDRPPVDGETARRVLDLDRALLARVEAERARVGLELRQLAECRRLLESYRGAPPRSAAYFDGTG